MRTRNYFLAFAAGALLAVAVAWGVVAADYGRTIAEWRSWLSETAENRAAMIALWLAERRTDAHVIAMRPEVRALLASGRAADAAYTRALADVADEYGFDAVLLLRRDGSTAATSRAGAVPEPEARRLAEHSLGDSAAVEVVPDRGDQVLLAVAAPVRAAAGGAPLGAVLVLISPERRLFPIALQQFGRTDGEVILARVTGNVAQLIAATWDSARTHASDRLGLDTAGAERARLFGPGSPFERYVDYDGKANLASSARLPAVDWVLVVKVPEATALSSFQRTARLVVLALVLALAALALGLRVLARRAEAKARETAAQIQASERRFTEAETALRQSEERYRALVESARDLIFVIDADHQLAWLNPAFETLTGWPRDAWIGRPFVDILVEEDRPAARAVFGHLLRGQAGRPTAQFRLRAREGEPRIGEFTGTPQVRDGQVVGILGVCRDVTERVTMEQHLRQASRMEAVGQLAGGIAHDFNNLLTVIIGSSELLLADMPPDAAWREDVQEIRNSAGRAALLTRQLLAFSRRQMLELREIDLNSIVTGAAGMLRRLIGEHIALDVKLGAGLGIVRADPGQLEQVIVNLAVNARDAMAAGGTLTIATAELASAQLVPVGSTHLPPGRWCVLEVRDTGVGMTPEVMARVFEPFFTTKEPGKGTGLGLASVYGVIKQSDGYIAVDSAPGAGSTFRIYLPRLTEAAEREAAGGDGPPVPGGTETVLLVEDEATVRAVAMAALRRSGYRVLEAASGQEALGIMATGAAVVDLLLTDVVMPGMNGPELAERARKRKPGLKVLFTSGYVEHAVENRGRFFGGAPLLTKPFTPEDLARRVREVLDQD